MPLRDLPLVDRARLRLQRSIGFEPLEFEFVDSEVRGDQVVLRFHLHYRRAPLAAFSVGETTYRYAPDLELAIPDPAPLADNASQELVDLARAGDRDGFTALAGCLMPADEVEECWAGTRQRLGLGGESS